MVNEAKRQSRRRQEENMSAKVDLTKSVLHCLRLQRLRQCRQRFMRGTPRHPLIFRSGGSRTETETAVAAHVGGGGRHGGGDGGEESPLSIIRPPSTASRSSLLLSRPCSLPFFPLAWRRKAAPSPLPSPLNERTEEKVAAVAAVVAVQSAKVDGIELAQVEVRRCSVFIPRKKLRGASKHILATRKM